jgi:hypothetical protein
VLSGTFRRFRRGGRRARGRVGGLLVAAAATNEGGGADDRESTGESFEGQIGTHAVTPCCSGRDYRQWVMDARRNDTLIRETRVMRLRLQAA